MGSFEASPKVYCVARGLRGGRKDTLLPSRALGSCDMHEAHSVIHEAAVHSGICLFTTKHVCSPTRPLVGTSRWSDVAGFKALGSGGSASAQAFSVAPFAPGPGCLRDVLAGRSSENKTHPSAHVQFAARPILRLDAVMSAAPEALLSTSSNTWLGIDAGE